MTSSISRVNVCTAAVAVKPLHMKGQNKRTNITLAVARLLSASDDQELTREEALFHFISELRWPYTSRREREGAYRLMLAKYLADKARAGQIAWVELEQKVDLSDLLEFCASDDWSGIAFKVWPQDDDAWYFPTALIVRLLLSWVPVSKDRRDAASLKKAHFALEEGYYGRARKISWGAFSTIWARYKSVCFFHYVNEFHFGRRMLLDPAKKGFTGQVNEILTDRVSLETFFREALYVKQRLRDILYRSVWTGEELATFPHHLSPKPVKTPLPDKELTEIISRY